MPRARRKRNPVTLAGRSRKPSSERERDGSPTALRRARDQGCTPEEAANDDGLRGSALGLLHVHRKITREQYDAGKTFGEMLAEYFKVIDAPRQPGPHSWMRGSTGQDPDPDSYVGMELVRRHRKVMRRMSEAYLALSGAGLRPKMAVLAACNGAEHVDLIELSPLVAGLDALVSFYGLTHKNKPGTFPIMHNYVGDSV